MKKEEYARKLVALVAEIVDCYTMSEQDLCFRNGITHGESKLIAHMKPENEFYVHSMATDLELSKSRICRLVESLRRKKIVTKVENDKDHRYNNIKLTKKGIEVRDSFLNDRLQRCLTIITPIDDSKLDNLIPLLNMLQDEFTRYKEELKKTR